MSQTAEQGGAAEVPDFDFYHIGTDAEANKFKDVNMTQALESALERYDPKSRFAISSYLFQI